MRKPQGAFDDLDQHGGGYGYSAAETYASVGALLRDARLASGRQLPEIAEELNIRPRHLQAIEESRFNDLPGPAYALGFVRAYAEHLGLDSADVVRRFKAEASGLNGRTDLNFPEPVSENRLPGAATIVLCLLIAAGSYGAWQYLSPSSDGARPERVAEVPARLAPLLPEQGTPAPAETVSSGARAEEAGTRAHAGSGEAAGTSTASPSAPLSGGAVEPVDPPAGPSAEVTPPETAEDEIDAADEAPATAAEPEATVSAGAAFPPVQSEWPVIPAVPGLADNATQVAGPAADEAPAEQLAAAEPSIVLRATLASWVRVRDSSNNEVFNRILEQGDSYEVPSGGGYRLETGNAGGLEILVDGREAPAIGPLGAVRRNVALDPERLLAGRAVP